MRDKKDFSGACPVAVIRILDLKDSKHMANSIDIYASSQPDFSRRPHHYTITLKILLKTPISYTE